MQGSLELAFRIVMMAVAVGIALWLMVTLRHILLVVLLSIILASGLKPLVDYLQRRGLPRAAAVLLIYLGLIGLLITLGFAVIPPIVHEVEVVVRNAPRYGEIASDFVQDLREQFPFLPPLDEQIIQQARGLGAQIGAIASQVVFVARFAVGIFSGVLSTFLVLLITLYLIVDGSRIREYFLSFLIEERRPQLRMVMDRMGQRMGGWLLGQLTLVGVVGVLSYIGLSLLGIPGAILLATIAGVGEAIPIVGPVVTMIPALIVALFQSPQQALGVVLLFIGIQQLENNLLVPRIMERAVAIHPLAVVLSLLVGGELLGILGAIVAVPVAAAVSVALDEVRWTKRKPGPDDPLHESVAGPDHVQTQVASATISAPSPPGGSAHSAE